MADLYIKEYRDMIVNLNGATVPVGQEDGSVVEQKVATIGASAKESSAFNSRTRFIRIVSDVAFHVAFGASPSADTTNMYCPADSPEYFGVNPSGISGQKLSVRTA